MSDTRRRGRTNMAIGNDGLPQLSPGFLAKVRACEDLDAFRDFLNRNGCWLNNRAAADVFNFLKARTEGELVSDEQLAEVRGGTTSSFDLQVIVPILMEINERFQTMRE